MGKVRYKLGTLNEQLHVSPLFRANHLQETIRTRASGETRFPESWPVGVVLHTHYYFTSRNATSNATVVKKYPLAISLSLERWRMGVELCNTTHTTTILVVTLLVTQQ
jgi:hypothetical protein